MKLTPLQEGLLRALDSKRFPNVAEYLHRHGSVQMPGPWLLRFTWVPDGSVVIDYDPNNPNAGAIVAEARRACDRWAFRLRRHMREDGIRQPSLPRYRLNPVTNPPITRS